MTNMNGLPKKVRLLIIFLINITVKKINICFLTLVEQEFQWEQFSSEFVQGKWVKNVSVATREKNVSRHKVVVSGI